MKILVLFDGHCNFCRTSVHSLKKIDWLNNLQLVHFRDEDNRQRYAPEITLEELERAMHIKIGERKKKGFDAIRYICWYIPLLLPIAPFLYIPGVAPLGRKIYAHIAHRRNTCANGDCAFGRN